MIFAFKQIRLHTQKLGFDDCRDKIMEKKGAQQSVPHDHRDKYAPDLRTSTETTLAPHASAGVVGLLLRSVRVFRQFLWLGVGSGKVALPRPTHQYPYGA